MSGGRVAWVESPLQLLSVAEAAAAAGDRPTVAYRITSPQMSATVVELNRLRSPLAAALPYAGIPWALLSQHRDWIVGDPFSGQFRLAVSVLNPRSITVVDDGDMTVHLAEVLLGRGDYARRGQRESGLKSLLAPAAHSRLLGLAARERLALFTAFAAEPALGALAATGVPVRANAFDWLRGRARPIDLPHRRVVLGSAGVTDGGITADAYLTWLGDVLRDGPAAYLPHRRESREQLELVRTLPGATVVETGLPVELALAGTAHALEVVAYRSSAVRTLARVLAGTGTRIHATAGTAPA
jgi:hypothetical protein